MNTSKDSPDDGFEPSKAEEISVKNGSRETLKQKIKASLAGALVAETMAGSPTGALHMLSAAESLAHAGHFDEEELKSRGLSSIPPCGPAGVLVRAIPYGLEYAYDRPSIRRNAYKAAMLAGVDEATAVVAMTTAILAADLTRFDLETSLTRVHQTVLEEAPMALLTRLSILPEGTDWVGDTDPLTAFQIAITVLGRVTGIKAVLELLLALPHPPAIAMSLAAALAGSRDGMLEIDSAWLEQTPAASRVIAVSTSLADQCAVV